jgi:chromosome segregation ATPase
MERTAKALAKEKEVLQQRIRDLETEVHAQKLEVQTWKTKYLYLANKVRDLPLEQVAHELGLDPDPKDKHKWKNSDHIINIGYSPNTCKFRTFQLIRHDFSGERAFQEWKKSHDSVNNRGLIALLRHICPLDQEEFSDCLRK